MLHHRIKVGEKSGAPGMTGNSGWYPRADGSLYRRSRSLEQSAHMAILAQRSLGTAETPPRLCGSQRDLQGRCRPSAESRRPIRILSEDGIILHRADEGDRAGGRDRRPAACNRHKPPRAFSLCERRCAARVHVDRRASGESRPLWMFTITVCSRRMSRSSITSSSRSSKSDRSAVPGSHRWIELVTN